MNGILWAYFLATAPKTPSVEATHCNILNYGENIKVFLYFL